MVRIGSKLLPCASKSRTLVRTPEPLRKGVNDIEFGWTDVVKKNLCDACCIVLLYKFQVHIGAMHHDVTISSKDNMLPKSLSCLPSDYLLPCSGDSITRCRPLSEPCVVTDLCLNSDMHTLSNDALGSVELLKRIKADGCTEWIDICAMCSSSNGSRNRTNSDKTSCMTDACSNSHAALLSVHNDYPQHITDVPRPSASLLKERCVNSTSSVTGTTAVDEKCQLNYVETEERALIVGGSLWRKVEPGVSRRSAVAEQANVSLDGTAAGIPFVPSSQRALNDAGRGNVMSVSLQHDVSRFVADDETHMTEMQASAQLKQKNVRGDSSLCDTVLVAVDSCANSETSYNGDKNVSLPTAYDECERRVDDGDESDVSQSETGCELTDNNVVTAHQLRDDIPDSELIDYSDDGGESLIDSTGSTSASVRQQVQIFIALFDYDPATMSPNPDAVESELPFCEGQLITVCNRTTCFLDFHFFSINTK